MRALSRRDLSALDLRTGLQRPGRVLPRSPTTLLCACSRPERQPPPRLPPPHPPGTVGMRRTSVAGRRSCRQRSVCRWCARPPWSLQRSSWLRSEPGRWGKSKGRACCQRRSNWVAHSGGSWAGYCSSPVAAATARQHQQPGSIDSSQAAAAAAGRLTSVRQAHASGRVDVEHVRHLGPGVRVVAQLQLLRAAPGYGGFTRCWPRACWANQGRDGSGGSSVCGGHERRRAHLAQAPAGLLATAEGHLEGPVLVHKPCG